MKNIRLSELNFVFDKRENSKDESSLYSEMSREERSFVQQLIQTYQPENIVEIGVSAGGGTINLLQSLEELDTKWHLTSIDIDTSWYLDRTKEVGWRAKSKYDKYLGNQWNFITGKDPSEVMLSWDTPIDFCIIDTNHMHPIETLNFISVLPHLSEGAIVVIHDISVYYAKDYLGKMLAPRVLFAAVVAEKYVPRIPSLLSKEQPNIAAVRVTKDTKKYSRNIFDILYYPWEIDVFESTKKSLKKLVSKFYTDEELSIYLETTERNPKLLRSIKNKQLKNTLDAFSKGNTIFYGAGKRMQEFLENMKEADMDFGYPIWDRNADKIGNLMGIPVEMPDYSTQVTGNIMVVMIEDIETFEEIKKKFTCLGYIVLHGVTI